MFTKTIFSTSILHINKIVEIEIGFSCKIFLEKNVVNDLNVLASTLWGVIYRHISDQQTTLIILLFVVTYYTVYNNHFMLL